MHRLVARQYAGAVDDAGILDAQVPEWSVSGPARTL
jgi:hypothetical protein